MLASSVADAAEFISRDGSTYAYRAAEPDGRRTGKPVTFRYLGLVDGEHVGVDGAGAGMVEFRCAPPCEAARVTRTADGPVQDMPPIRMPAGSVVRQFFADAMAGELVVDAPSASSVEPSTPPKEAVIALPDSIPLPDGTRGTVAPKPRLTADGTCAVTYSRIPPSFTERRGCAAIYRPDNARAPVVVTFLGERDGEFQFVMRPSDEPAIAAHLSCAAKCQMTRVRVFVANRVVSDNFSRGAGGRVFSDAMRDAIAGNLPPLVAAQCGTWMTEDGQVECTSATGKRTLHRLR